MRFFSVLLVVCAALVPVQGAASDQITRKAALIEAAFFDWLEAQGGTHGTIALRHQGQQVARAGKGWRAEEPVEIASLSKAVTALCVDALASEGALRLDDPAGPFFGITGGPRLADVITQTGGIGPDRTQRKMPGWLAKDRGRDRDRWGEAGRHALERVPGEHTPKPGTYSYNNENYAILGAVIESATGERYEDACRKRVLDRAGVAAARSPMTGSFLPWGGWRMTAPDYAALVDAAWGPGGWLEGRETPRSTIEGPVSYGLGMVHRKVGNGENRFHFGGLCFQPDFNRGAFAVQWQSGWTVVVAYDLCLDDGGAKALDAALNGALFGP